MLELRAEFATPGLVLLTLLGSVAAAAAQPVAPGQNDMQKGQSTVNGQVMQNAGPAGSGPMSIRQGIQSQLQQAGFTDVSVTPSSFYVRARDKQGHPVAMVIGPDSVTAVTEVPSTGGTPASGPGGGPAGERPTAPPQPTP